MTKHSNRTIVGTLICLMVLVVGVTSLKPRGYVARGRASLQTAQIEAMIADYKSLAMVVGHRPTYADYASVYAAGSSNFKYELSPAGVAIGSTIDPKSQWSYSATCGASRTQDCFCLTVVEPDDVTYKAMQISAAQQLVDPAQSRVKLSIDSCDATGAIADPAQWPEQIPAQYFLTVYLNTEAVLQPAAPTIPPE